MQFNKSRKLFAYPTALTVICLLAITFAPLAADDDKPFRDPRRVYQTGDDGDGAYKRFSKASLVRRSSRWNILSDLGVYPRHIFDPYNQNVLKGDFPFLGNNNFLVFTNVLVPKTVFNNQEGAETAFNTDNVTSLELFKGATVFKPKDWSIKSSAKTIFNRGNGNDLEDIAFLELFGELKLFDVGSNFDFVSTRNGLQFFKTDFNGLIFQDFNLGYALFSELWKNQVQWNAAFVDRRVKENGQLTFDALGQQVAFGNWFWEDFLRPGFNSVTSFHYNRDRSIEGNELDVFYAGIASAGHWGRYVFSPAFYFAFGDDVDVASGEAKSVQAFLAGVEMEYPLDYLNYRAAAFFASGDNNPNDDVATGFASINENINLFGAGNSFIVGGNAFSKPNSFIASNQGPSAFENPGMLLLNAGLDIVFTPKLFFASNFNYAQFVNPESAINTNNTEIGMEVNGAINYRLFLNENLVFQAAINAFFPRPAGIDILESEQTVITSNLTLVTVF